MHTHSYKNTHTHTYIHTHKQTHAHTLIHTDRQTDKQTSKVDWSLSRKIYGFTYCFSVEMY